MTVPTIAAGFARGLVSFAVSKGADEKTLIARSHIDMEDLRDRDNRIPLDKYVALVRTAKELCNDPALSLHFAEEVDLSELSIVGLIGRASETVTQAFEQLNRYARLVVEVDLCEADRFQIIKKGGGLWLVDNRGNPNDFPELTEGTFTRMVCNSRQFWDRPFVKEVHFTHSEPGYRAEYDRIFQVPLRFDADWNAMRIDEAWDKDTVAILPTYIFGVLSKHADALLEDLKKAKTIRGRIESLLMPILHKGGVSVDVIAGKMAMSRQTLYRNLKAEGATFEQVLDELRHTLSLHYLNERKVSINETAYLVGFSDRAAFSRAFKRWTGHSPGELSGRMKTELGSQPIEPQ